MKKNKIIIGLLSLIVLISVVVFAGQLIFKSDVNADVNRQSFVVSKSVKVATKKYNIQAKISYTSSNIDNNQGNSNISRGEWIQMLADKVNMKLETQGSEIEYYYSDTKKSPYGISIETARVYDILPEQNKTTFKPDDLATREFVAYTVTKAMRFGGEYTADFADSSSLKYPSQCVIAIKQSFFSLENNYFNPTLPITMNDKDKIFAKIDEINKSTQIDTSKTHEEVIYNDNVIQETLKNITDYKVTYNSDSSITVNIVKNSATNKIKVNSVFVLPPNDEYISSIFFKATKINEKNGRLEIICSKPDSLGDVYKSINFEGSATPSLDNFIPASDEVTIEYDDNESSRKSKSIRRININGGGSVSVPGKVKFKMLDKKIGNNVKATGEVEITIPNFTCKVDASINGFKFNINDFILSITEKIKIKGELKYTVAESGYQLNSGSWNEGKTEIGRLPIPLGSTGLSVDVVLFYETSIKGTASITYTATMTQGFQIINGTPRSLNDFKQDINFLELKGSAKAGLGLALRVTAGSVCDLIGVDGQVGLGMDIVFTPRVTSPVIYCGDAAIYLYGKIGLDQDTIVGAFIKNTLHYELVEEFWKKDNSPLKLNWHFENMKKVDKCTVENNDKNEALYKSVSSVDEINACTYGIKKDNTLWAWGNNEDGQLGDGTTQDRYSPVKVMDNVISFECNNYSSYAIREDGSLWSWGNNSSGQLGDDTRQNRYSPVKIMDNVISVECGSSSAYAIKEDGGLWAWGSNLSGQLGDGTTQDRHSPVKVMDNVISVKGYSRSSYAIKEDGSLWAWGDNYKGQLGDGTIQDRHSPVKVMDNVISIKSNASSSYAIKKDGSLWAWGYNNFYGQLGDGTTQNRYNPVKVMDNVISIECYFDSSSYAIKEDKSLWAWGQNNGQLGDGTTQNRHSPVKITDNVIFVKSCRGTVYIIKEDGSLWAWGDNYKGQLGDGTTERRYSPIKVMDNVIYVGGGYWSCYTIKKDGSLWTWGYNHMGQLGDGTTQDRHSPVRITN